MITLKKAIGIKLVKFVNVVSRRCKIEITFKLCYHFTYFFISCIDFVMESNKRLLSVLLHSRSPIQKYSFSCLVAAPLREMNKQT